MNLINGLDDARADNTLVLSIAGGTYSDFMGSGYQQDVKLLQLFYDVAVYDNLIMRQDMNWRILR
jgi:thiamine pyrophosphate-dependent acetolactate synthase large subunit-like protein